MRSPGKVEFYKDASGQWRWRVIASNGRILADSAEGYSRRRGAERGLVAVMSILKA